MKRKLLFSLLLSGTLLVAQAQRTEPDHMMVKGSELTIQPVMHASLVLTYRDKTVYVDPAGGAGLFKGLAAPDAILITDIHGDHLDSATLMALDTKNAIFIVPQAVADQLPPSLDKKRVVVMNNGDTLSRLNFSITAIPMYNLPEAPDAFHTKGRGNGYVLAMGEKKIYISGDTEDIPEMRSLQGIDIAFVCMNLPYTMPVEQAAEGVLAFKPRIVYPYHYRGQDVNEFKKMVNEKDKSIEVRLKNWYPAAQ